MSPAVIRNSDYESIEAAKAAIDRHFSRRNAFLRSNPRRAGRKIWDQEDTPSESSASNSYYDGGHRVMARCSHKSGESGTGVEKPPRRGLVGVLTRRSRSCGRLLAGRS
jgi:hypothetical protein